MCAEVLVMGWSMESGNEEKGRNGENRGFINFA